MLLTGRQRRQKQQQQQQQQQGEQFLEATAVAGKVVSVSELLLLLLPVLLLQQALLLLLVGPSVEYSFSHFTIPTIDVEMSITVVHLFEKPAVMIVQRRTRKRRLPGDRILPVTKFIILFCPRQVPPISSLHDQSDTIAISAPSTAPSPSPPLNIKGGSIGDCTNSIDDGDHPRTAAAAASRVLVANNCTRPPRASKSGCNYAAVDEGKRTEERHAAVISSSSSSSSDAAAPQIAVDGGNPSAAAAVADDYQRKKRIQGDYAYFVKNTYSKQCALLGYNFHALLCGLGIYDLLPYDQDTRLVSVTLMYIFYKYQLHPCDIALNLATALIYLQDTPSDVLRELGELGHNAFNVVVYHTYLAHAWNDDVTIKLKDWYNEVGRLYFPSVAAMNDFVWAIFSKGRGFHLFVEERRVGRYVKKLCSLPM
ncbi:hypothetical protein FOZ61_009063 [Perkinsus olseni]|uniref:Uncharacterized protein n=2 Tax=Perkinsus olseni TaxID=32597 RepID=A0A7J6L1L8_PEROL|nr:hypothetical protein FOZ61_009063 [Perkinsus olseni]